MVLQDKGTNDAPLAASCEQSSKEAPLCDNCEEAPSELFCRDCKAHMCKDCADTLHAMKALRKHVLVPAALAAPRLSPDETQVEAAGPAQSDAQRVKCLEHDEPFKYVCLDCCTVACIDCKEFGAHKGHRHDLLRNVAVQQRQQLNAAQATMVSASKSARETSDAVRLTLAELGVQQGPSTDTCTNPVDVAKEQIRKHYVELHTALEQGMNSLLADMGTMQTGKIEGLQRQASELQAFQEQVSSARTQAQAAIHVSSLLLTSKLVY